MTPCIKERAGDPQPPAPDSSHCARGVKHSPRLHFAGLKRSAAGVRNIRLLGAGSEPRFPADSFPRTAVALDPRASGDEGGTRHGARRWTTDGVTASPKGPSSRAGLGRGCIISPQKTQLQLLPEPRAGMRAKARSDGHLCKARSPALRMPRLQPRTKPTATDRPRLGLQTPSPGPKTQMRHPGGITQALLGPCLG